MNKLTDRLGEIGIHNPHNLVCVGHPLLWYRPQDKLESSAFMLSVKGRAFKKAPWYDYGAKSFCLFEYDNDRNKALACALAKCHEMFPEIEMVKGPWPMTYVPKCDLDAALKKIKENCR